MNVKKILGDKELSSDNENNPKGEIYNGKEVIIEDNDKNDIDTSKQESKKPSILRRDMRHFAGLP